MAAGRVLYEEVVRFWHIKGVPPCAEAQADGVPCPSLGRDCETCAQAIRAVESAREPHLPPEPEAQS